MIELAVVVGIIGVLAVMLLPALAGPRSNGQAFQCLNNTKQLALGAIMYANDNSEMLMNPGNWVNAGSGYNYEDWTSYAGNTNSQLMFDPGITRNSALIAPYVKTPITFKCPADVYSGPAGPRARSYSMNGALGGAPSFGTSYPFSGPRTYFSARKTVELNTPGPAKIFVFLDEHPDSINDAVFMLDSGKYDGVASEYWRDFPGSLHDGAVSISFADGHSEIHKWTESRTCQPVEFKSFSTAAPQGTTPLNHGVNLHHSADYEWLEDRMPYHY